jgi:hypothetical protein
MMTHSFGTEDEPMTEYLDKASDKITLSTPVGTLDIDYFSSTGKAGDAQLLLDVSGPHGNYAMLFKQGHIGTRNGTRVFEPRDTPDGEAHYDTAFTQIHNVLAEHYNHHQPSADVVNVLRESAGIELPQASQSTPVAASWRDRQAKRQKIFDYIAGRAA